MATTSPTLKYHQHFQHPPSLLTIPALATHVLLKMLLRHNNTKMPISNLYPTTNSAQLQILNKSHLRRISNRYCHWVTETISLLWIQQLQRLTILKLCLIQTAITATQARHFRLSSANFPKHLKASRTSSEISKNIKTSTLTRTEAAQWCPKNHLI